MISNFPDLFCSYDGLIVFFIEFNNPLDYEWTNPHYFIFPPAVNIAKDDHIEHPFQVFQSHEVNIIPARRRRAPPRLTHPDDSDTLPQARCCFYGIHRSTGNNCLFFQLQWMSDNAGTEDRFLGSSLLFHSPITRRPIL